MQTKIIKILVADESLPFLTAFRQATGGDQALRIVGTAGGWEELRKKIAGLSPDVIVLNAAAPLGGNLSALMKLIRSAGNTPMVVVGSGKMEQKQIAAAFSAEYVPMPNLRERGSFSAFSNEVCVKIKLKARLSSSSVSFSAPECSLSREIKDFRYHVIAIGASTGGTEATAQIMEVLPKEMPGIVIVQHMPPAFTQMYAERLNRISRMEVSEARSGDRVKSGRALVAAGGKHMYLRKDANGYCVQCAEGEKVNGHCPSVGVLFDSVAETAGPDAIGVILTGMGHDGAQGLLNMRKAGAYTVGQNEESCVVYGMPMVAYELGAVMEQAPCESIARILTKQVQWNVPPEK